MKLSTSKNYSGAILIEANLSGANLRWADLRRADLRRANLRWANLRWANLSWADLSEANLSWADLRRADLSGADLSGADLSGADLSGADLRWADLRRADLRRANLSEANLSEAIGLINQSDWINENIKSDNDGLIVYKSFGSQYKPNENWKIAAGAIITEVVNPCRVSDCACGINVATLKWFGNNHSNDIWKCRIPWKYVAGIVVPYHTDGKFRTEYLELIEVVQRGTDTL